MDRSEGRGSTHGRTVIRDILPEESDDVYGDEDYEDVRLELRAMGHNLTSVLINPRESLMDELTDEFVAEQALPLDLPYVHVKPNTLSSHSQHELSGGSSHHQSMHSTSHSMSMSSHSIGFISGGGGSGGSSYLSTLMALTGMTYASSSSSSSSSVSEAEKVHGKEIAERLQRIFKEYHKIHRHGVHNSQPTSNSSSAAAAAAAAASAASIQDDHVYREVPEIFFRPDFRLTLAEIFDQTIKPETFKNNGSSTHENSSSSSSSSYGGGGSRRRARTSSYSGEGSQQEYLTRYLDLVELALLKQIWSRSPQFFKALDEIKALQFQVSQATTRLKTLRDRLREVDERVALTAIRIPQMHRRQKNEIALCSKLQHMHNVLQSKVTIQALLESEDYVGALEVIDSARNIYLAELNGMTCMRATGLQLEQYHSFVCEVMCSKFVSTAIQWDDMNEGGDEEGLGDGDSSRRRQSESSGGNKPKGGSLEELLRALILVGRLPPALSMYKSRLSEAIKLIIRTCVMEYLQSFDPTQAVDLADELPPESPGGTEQPFVSRVKGMPNDHFLSSLQMTYEQLLLALGRAARVHDYINANLADLMGGGDAAASVQEAEPLQLEESVDSSSMAAAVAAALSLSKSATTVGSGSGSRSASSETSPQEAMLALSKQCMSTAIDLSQRSVAQLLTLRKDSNCSLPLDRMKFLWETSLHFVTQIEKVSGTSAYTIRQALLVQTSGFLSELHKQSKLALKSTLDNEKWVQCDVSAERQAAIDRLAAGKAFLAGAGTTEREREREREREISDAAAAKDKAALVAATTAAAAAAAATTKKNRLTKPAMVDGVPFRVVWSSLLLTEQCLQYLDIAVSFAPGTGEIITMTNDLITLFNNTTKNLILSSGAQKSQAQLRSISAKHLATTSQSIGLVLALIPHIRTALLAQLPTNLQMRLLEIDRVTSGLLDHHGQILAKFVVILGDTVDLSASKLAGVDWDRFQPGGSGAIDGGKSEYFEEIIKNVTTLHRVLHTDSLLPAEQLNDVFSRIFQQLSRKIPMHFEQIAPATLTGRQRILDEITHMSSSFSVLRDVDCSAAMAALEGVFRAKFGMLLGVVGGGGGAAGIEGGAGPGGARAGAYEEEDKNEVGAASVAVVPEVGTGAETEVEPTIVGFETGTEAESTRPPAVAVAEVSNCS